MADGTASPLTVPGLANGVSHACTVAAHCTAGFGAESNVVSVTPVLRSGIVLWTNTCSGCHTKIPIPALRAWLSTAGDTGTDAGLRAAQSGDVLANAGDTVVDQQRAFRDCQIHLSKTFCAAINVNTEYVTPKMIDVGLPNHPVSGRRGVYRWRWSPTSEWLFVSVFSSTLITYTPNAGFAGTDSFTYRGKRTRRSCGRSAHGDDHGEYASGPVITSQRHRGQWGVQSTVRLSNPPRQIHPRVSGQPGLPPG